MFLKAYLNHPIVKRYIKTTNAKEYLFKQGQIGNSMYLIVDGVIQLHDDSSDPSNLIGTFGPGQFFGERSLLNGNPYQRFFSAKSLARSSYLEFGLADVAQLQTAVPDFMLHIFQAAVSRLERAYHLNRILKSTQLHEKLVHGILYFYRCPGLSATAGSLIAIRVRDLSALMQLERPRVKEGLELLAQKGILVKGNAEEYFLKDEKDLIRAIPDLDKATAA